MLMLATTIWVILVAPVATAAMPNPKEFMIETVEFASLADCDAAARKWQEELTDAAFAPRHALRFGNKRTRYAPAGAAVTYTCVERTR
jgi:hypothetical protein